MREKVRRSRAFPDSYICPRCGGRYSLESFFYRSKNGTIEIYWQGCKSCYRKYRKELRVKVKVAIGSISLKKMAYLSENIRSIRREDKWSASELRRAVRRIDSKSKCIGRGLHRIVFSIGDFVIKIDRKAGGRGQNRDEIEKFKEIQKQPKRIQEYFMPIIAYDKVNFEWIIMPKAKTQNNDDFSYKKSNDLTNKIERAFRREGIDMADLHGNNVGEYKGKPVVIDYGYPLHFKGE